MVNVSKAARAYVPAKKLTMSKKKTFVFKLFEYLVIFLIGGFAYCGIEILWRGHTHPSMFILGGVCLIAVGLLNEGIFPENFGIIPQMIMGGLIITALEFITGLIVNIGLGLNVWDYSDMPLNLMGQICLPFTLAWMLLSFVAIVVDDWLRYTLFDELWPEYKLWMAND